MTNQWGRQRRPGALGNQTFSLPRARADQRQPIADRQMIADIVVLLLALLLVAALALRLFAAGPAPTVSHSLMAVGAALLQLGR